MRPAHSGRPQRPLYDRLDEARAEQIAAVIVPADVGLPDRSWWLDLRDRTEFSSVARVAFTRMRHSRLARSINPPTMERAPGVSHV
jgi:hypothetical protein